VPNPRSRQRDPFEESLARASQTPREFRSKPILEDMAIPLGVVATDLASGQPVPFSGAGEAFDSIRASCFYPGLFQPVRRGGQILVDGAMSMEMQGRASGDVIFWASRELCGTLCMPK
jgi:predicted acylesterase/phospholipase RssA